MNIDLTKSEVAVVCYALSKLSKFTENEQLGQRADSLQDRLVLDQLKEDLVPSMVLPSKQPKYPHKYDAQLWNQSECEYGCGCWRSRASSGSTNAVLDIDPLGECPNNPGHEEAEDT